MLCLFTVAEQVFERSMDGNGIVLSGNKLTVTLDYEYYDAENNLAVVQSTTSKGAI